MDVARIGSKPFLVGFLAIAAIVGAGFSLFLGSIAPSPKLAPGASSVSTSASVDPSIPTVSPPSLVPRAGIVLELEGTGNVTTDPFAVEPGWQVVWQTDGTTFSYAVHGAQDLGTVIKVTEPSKGANAFAPSGTFRIEIAAAGPWSIKVLQGGQ